MLEQVIEFEQCVAQAFEQSGFTPRKLTDPDTGIDFVLTLKNISQYAVEVKFYRSKYPKNFHIKISAKRLLVAAKRENISKAILVISSSVSNDLRVELENRFQITIIDRFDILSMTSNKPELNDKLRALLGEDPQDKDLSGQSIFDSITKSDRDTSNVQAPQIKYVGEMLINELKRIPAGKANWRKYEVKCEEILRYLFDGDLRGWHNQKRTDDGLNRYDLICRVRPLSEFWAFIIEDLNSRYVLFEFKNYRGFIKQGQILTTEKYLLKHALRSVAFVISRKGEDKNARLTIQGAMREHGKLMPILRDDDLFIMLRMKDSGDDPADFLFELVDNFLMTLPR